MKNQIFFSVLALSLFFSCSLDDSSNSQQNELNGLNQQKAAIEQMAASISCDENSVCKSVAFGSKPCGGPWSYLAYNSDIDENLFLNKIAAYNANEAAYNNRWNISSDCMAVEPPIGVECIDGKCTTIYN